MGDKEIGDNTLCVRYGPEKNRPLNLTATSLRDLIKWDLPTAKESPLTVKLSKVVSFTLIFKIIGDRLLEHVGDNPRQGRAWLTRRLGFGHLNCSTHSHPCDTLEEFAGPCTSSDAGGHDKSLGELSISSSDILSR